MSSNKKNKIVYLYCMGITVPTETAGPEISKKIFQLINYFDLFDYPLSLEEIETLLNCGDKTEFILALTAEVRRGRIETFENYYFKSGKKWTVEKKKKEKKYFEQNKNKIYLAGLILSYFPFVRAVFLSGTAAKGVLNKFDDFDFFIIAKSGRLWICKTLIVLFRRLISLNCRNTNYKYFCCNYFLSEDGLCLPDRDEFTALETVFAQPVFNRVLHERFLQFNNWVFNYFPRAKQINEIPVVEHKRFGVIQMAPEKIINFFCNDRLEHKLCEMYGGYWEKSGKSKDFGKNYIKPDSGLRQKYLTGKFIDFDESGNRNKLTTKIMLKTLSRKGTDMRGENSLLLTHAYFLSKTRAEKRIMRPFAPLGPLYVAAYLKKKGYNVDFYDTTFRSGPASFAKYIREHPVSLVGIYLLETSRINALEMIKICRAEGITVIAGGPDASTEPEFYLENGANLVVVGEGEETMAKIMEAISAGNRQITDIAGVYSEKGFAGGRKLIEDIDSIPLPAREMVDYAPYFNLWKKKHGITQMLICGSRGCPYNCRWCSKPVFGRSFRQRTAESVAEEMLFLKKTYNPDTLWFNDDIFGMSRKWISDFSKEVNNKNAKIPFECLSRVDLVDVETLKLIKDSGCFRINYGVESGSQKILDNMNKRFTINDVRFAASATKKAGIELGYFLMFGYAGETLSDIEKTFDLVKETMPDQCSSAIIYPMKGTEFYREVKNNLLPYALKHRLENRNILSVKTPLPQIFYNVARRLMSYEAMRVRGIMKGVERNLKYAIIRFLYYTFRLLYKRALE